MRTTRVVWNGQPVDAADPAPIADWVPQLTERTIRRTEQAVAAVERVGAAAARRPGVLVAQLLHRAEGVASSEIEALRAGGGAIAMAQAAGVDVGGDAAWIADNLAVVADATGDRRRIDSELLFEWHTRLMRHGRIEPGDIGVFRNRLGWIGGLDPRTAVHVAAPAELIGTQMDDLYRFCERDDLDAVTLAAVAHAQFETIHPFADGNGRIGRVLISNLLARRCSVAIPPPLSLQLRRDVGGYQAGLTLFRVGEVDAWVRWFADAVLAAAELAESVVADAVAIVEQWRGEVADLRADAAARRLVDHLADHPVVTADLAARWCDVTPQAARTALAQLRDRGVLTELDVAVPTPGRPRRWFAATALLDLVDR